MPNNESDAKFTVINMSAEAKKAWGDKWNAPEVAYEWSNGKKHYLRTEDAAIYETSPDFPG
jgi:hypothetical protein